MVKNKRIIKILGILLVAVFALQVASCGYFMYPERRGQRGGRIDPAVAILDGLGLLLFIIPGVIAFAVDFTNGTIYLPYKRASHLHSSEYSEYKDLMAVPIDRDKLNKRGIEQAVEEQIDRAISLDSKDLKVYELEDMDHFWVQYALAMNTTASAK